MGKNKQAILLLSGGIDSTTLLAHLIHQEYSVYALSFAYQQKHQLEMSYASHNAILYNVTKHHIITLDERSFQQSALVNQNLTVTNYDAAIMAIGQVNTYVPFRNLIFMSHALSWAESLQIKEIYIAVNKDDSANYWDCSANFFNMLQQIANQSNADIKIKTPFINLSKSEVIQLANKLNVDLQKTITCYQPNEQGTECGKCLSCRVKQEALNALLSSSK